MKNEIRYYNTFEDDFIESKNQDYKIPEDYKWIRRGIFSRILSVIIYCAAVIFGSIYSVFSLRLCYKNRKKMRGALIFGNHTQPIGDIFIPALCSLPERIYVVVSPANYGIPVIGKILPYLGALPVSDTVSGTRKLTEAIGEHLKRGKNIVIYPEAHVWEYYTDIRPFSEKSFKFAVKFSCPVYCTTATYKKSRFGKKPKTEVYVDGPFYADTDLCPKAAAIKLRDEVYETMKRRCENSTYEYIKYKEREIKP